MMWAVAIGLSLVTGFVASKSLIYYYHLRYRLKTESKKFAAAASDIVFMLLVLSMGWAPQIALAKVASENVLKEKFLAVAIVWLFLLWAYFSVKKSNPHIIKNLFGAARETNQSD